MERESSYIPPRNKPTKKIPQLPPSPPQKKATSCKPLRGERKKKGDQKKPRGLVKKSPRTPSNSVTFSKIVMGLTNHYLSPSIGIKWRDSHPAANGSWPLQASVLVVVPWPFADGETRVFHTQNNGPQRTS